MDTIFNARCQNVGAKNRNATAILQGVHIQVETTGHTANKIQ